MDTDTEQTTEESGYEYGEGHDAGSWHEGAYGYGDGNDVDGGYDQTLGQGGYATADGAYVDGYQQPESIVTPDQGFGDMQALPARHQTVDPPPWQHISIARNVQEAQALVAALEGYRVHMVEGTKSEFGWIDPDSGVTPEKMDANETAIALLNDYIASAGEQSQTLGSFLAAAQKAMEDAERYKAQLQSSLDLINVATIDAADKSMHQLTVSNGAVQQDAHEAQHRHEEMQKAREQVDLAQGKVIEANDDYLKALNTFESGIPTINTNPDQAKDLMELRSHIEDIKAAVGKGLELVGEGLEHSKDIIGEDNAKAAKSAVDHSGSIVDAMIDFHFKDKLNEIESKIAQYNAAHREHKITAELRDVKARGEALTSALDAFKMALEHFTKAQEQFRVDMQHFGDVADHAGHGTHYAKIAGVLAELDVYLIQLDDTLALGYQEQAAARDTSAKRKEFDGVVSYYVPVHRNHNYGTWNWECQWTTLKLDDGVTANDATEGLPHIGVNATVDQAILQVQQVRAQIEPMRQELEKAMNLHLDQDMPTAIDGPAPTARSSNTDL